MIDKWQTVYVNLFFQKFVVSTKEQTLVDHKSLMNKAIPARFPSSSRVLITKEVYKRLKENI